MTYRKLDSSALTLKDNFGWFPGKVLSVLNTSKQYYACPEVHQPINQMRLMSWLCFLLPLPHLQWPLDHLSNLRPCGQNPLALKTATVTEVRDWHSLPPVPVQPVLKLPSMDRVVPEQAAEQGQVFRVQPGVPDEGKGSPHSLPLPLAIQS